MTPRQLAYETLLRWTEGGPPATRLLEQRLAAGELASAGRGLATELVYGVARRRATLDALLALCVRRPLENVEAGSLTLLRLGVYQLVVLSGSPPYAVVSETVELARRVGRPQWTGFLNGVLRAASRNVTDEFVAAPAANAVPLAEGRFRIVSGKPFPDPQLDFAGWFAAAFSFPHGLVERWRRRMSNAELAALGFWFSAPAPLTLRVNPLRTTREALLAALAGAGLPAQPGNRPESVRIDRAPRVTDLPGFCEGWFTVQDESAMSAAALLAPEPGTRVLDLCAAPGGKSAHLAALMQDRGQVLAVDVEAPRLALVADTARRLGLSIIEPREARRDLADLPDGPFDAALVDVPCSNTGVLGKRPEARWRQSSQDLAELTALQRKLLFAALGRVRPAGRVVYSTCSIEPEENQDLVRSVLAERPGWRVAQEIEHTPGRPADGGYQALLLPESL